MFFRMGVQKQRLYGDFYNLFCLFFYQVNIAQWTFYICVLNNPAQD